MATIKNVDSFRKELASNIADALGYRVECYDSSKYPYIPEHRNWCFYLEEPIQVRPYASDKYLYLVVDEDVVLLATPAESRDHFSIIESVYAYAFKNKTAYMMAISASVKNVVA